VASLRTWLERREAEELDIPKTKSSSGKGSVSEADYKARNSGSNSGKKNKESVKA